MNALVTSSSVMALDDSALSQRVPLLVRRERKHLVEFLHHLAEFDTRKLYLGLGYSSLYAYCRDALRLSDGSAFRRYAVARLLPRFPVVADFLEDGRLNLKRLADLRDVLTAENHLDVLTRASLGTEQDVDVLVATLKPKPDVKDGIRQLSTRTITSTATKSEAALAPQLADPVHPNTPSTQVQLPATPASAMAETPTQPAAPLASPRADFETEPGPPVTDSLFATSTVEVPAAPRARRMEVEATSATAFSVRMRVGPEFLAEFEAVKAALSHKFPDGNFEDVLRECMRVTLDAIDRRRAAKTDRCGTAARREDAPASTQPGTTASDEAKTKSAQSRHIPAAVRRAVWKRDGGSCAFVSADGRRCDSRHRLEIHHKDPFAIGGPSTEENLSLRCRSHNAHEAELEFGADFMKAKASQKMRRSETHKALPPWKLDGAESKSPKDAAPSSKPRKLH